MGVDLRALAREVQREKLLSSEVPRFQATVTNNTGIRSTLRNLMRDGIDATGLEGGYRTGLLNLADGINTAADFAPVIGDAIALEDAGRSFNQGDMLGAVINMVGAVPIVGGLASKAAKGARSTLRDIGEGSSNLYPHATDFNIDDLKPLISDSLRVNKSQTSGPILVSKGADGKLTIMDGSHRYWEAKDRGERTVQGYFDPADDATSRMTLKQSIQAAPEYNRSTLRDISPTGSQSSLRGLDPSTAARMQRSEEGGFLPETVYTGTSADIEEFNPKEFGGSVTRAKSAKMGTWFSDNPEVSAGYAKMASEDMPVQRLVDASNAAERAGEWDKSHDLMAQAEKLEQSGELIDGGGQNIISARIRGNLFEVDVDGATMSDLDDSQLATWATKAKEEGFDGIKIKNFSDNADYGTYTPATHYLIFDPKNIRSTNAEFDPAKADSANLLSGIYGRSMSGAA